MTTTPELEKPDSQGPQEAPQQGEVHEAPTSAETEVSEQMAEQGVVATPSQITAQVADDSGKPMMQPTGAQAVTIQIPASPSQLHDWSQGDANSSLTWVAVYWLRLIKKALLYGWSVVLGGDNK